MNIDTLKQVLQTKGILVGEDSKDFIAVCYYCGDHHDKKKQGHLYVSKIVEKPVCHCFYCDKSVPLDVLIYDLTGDKKTVESIIPKSELDSLRTRSKTQRQIKTRTRKLFCPPIDTDKFPDKYEYLKTRIGCNTFDIHRLTNCIFDFSMFLRINDAESMFAAIHKTQQDADRTLRSLDKNYVGFLSTHSTVMICRGITEDVIYKHRKFKLQTDGLEMLDYVCFDGGDPTSNLIVLGEGVYDVLPERFQNNFNLYNKASKYACGLSFSYDALLKSICFDCSIYRADVVLLSDNDKSSSKYQYLYNSNAHVINSFQLYYNGGKKDFGVFPISPVPFPSASLKRFQKYRNKYKRSSYGQNIFQERL